MRRSQQTLALVLCLVSAATEALAQPPAAAPASVARGPDRPRVDDTTTASGGAGYGALVGRPRVRAARVDSPPQIDGRLDDEAWRTAAMLTEFVQQAPLDGAPATEQTEVYVAYDRDHIYFGFYLHYSDPGIMRANRVDRDTAWQDDLITVYLDTFLDQQRSYDFDLNAYNVQGDGVINTGLQQGGPIPIADRSWDALFHSGTEIVEDGYTAEMAIPFKSLRYPQRPAGVEHRWGFQIVREIKGKDQENVVWAPMSRDVRSFMEQMGVLEGMTDLSTSRNLELLPTFTAIRYESIDDVSGALVNRGTDPEGGLNVKYGITSNLTADFTANPDFSQIESDLPQIEINQRFPLFFPELRPFFLEGAEIFNIPAPVNLVHTRTLVDPNLGAKLTGKVGKTTLGVMLADDEAPGRRVGLGERGYDDNARVVIGRARYDLYAESHIGAVVTDRTFLDGYSQVGGIDGQFRLGRASRLNVIAVQSQHRDEEGTERSGPMWGALFQHAGRHLAATVFAAQIHPDFRTDVGFVQRVDQQLAGANLRYRWWPESWIINWGPSVNYQLNFNYERDPGGRERRCRPGLRLRPEHPVLRPGDPGARAVRGYGLPPAQLPGPDELEHQPPLLRRGQRDLGRSDPLRPEQSVSRARRQRAGVRHRPARPAVHVADRRRHQPVQRHPRRRRRGIPRPGPARAEHAHGHRPPAAKEHHGVQFVRRDVGDEPARHVPHQRADGVLRRLRRPLPAGESDRPRRGPLLPDDRSATDEPRVLHEAAGAAPVLNPAGRGRHERRRRQA